jgi:transposase InsO family protein
MDKGWFLIETHLRTGRSIKELAAAHDVSESWLFKLLRRYRLEGPDGLEPRSRRPKSSPSRIADLYEDEIVRVRKELTETGFDAGAETIHFHMSTPGRQVPSVSTIYRVLVARGFVVPEPHKRPKSSWIRFEADVPNECWQADVTHVEVAQGWVYEVLNIIDDHSRRCVASRAFVTTRAPDVVRTIHKAAERWGYPQRFLTDNGRIFTTPIGGGLGATAAELFSLGIATRYSRPYHPQTCGKVERFHQTLKKFIAKQEPATTKKLLQGQHPARGLECPGEGRTHRQADPSSGLSRPSRQSRRRRIGDAAPQGQAPPHRDRLSLCGLAGHFVGRRPRHPHSGTRRLAAAAPDLGPVGRLPADPLRPTTVQLYDVSRHRSPMSRDITKCAPRDSNPKPAD